MTRIARTLLVGLVACSALATEPILLAAAERGEVVWPQFRGPRGDGVADEQDVPVEFGPTKNVL